MELKRTDLVAKKAELEKKLALIEEKRNTIQLCRVSDDGKGEEKLQEQERRLMDELNMLKQELAGVQGDIDHLKRFNRDLCFKNIDYLLAQSDVKLGALETESGNTPGYISRMRSGKSSSDPSIEFLMTASEVFKVPLELLVSAELSGLSATEKYMLDFLKKVTEDTQADKLNWKRETVAELENLEVHYDGEGDLYILHPLYKLKDERFEGLYEANPQYESKFFKECGVKPHGDVFYAQLLPTDEELYIVECDKGDERLTWKSDRFYELYIVETCAYNKCNTKPLCNTFDASPIIVAALTEMVKSVLISRTHVQ